MKTTHVKGPWVAPYEQFNLVFTAQDWAEVHYGAVVQGMQIAVTGRNLSENEIRKTAQLVSASPEMLEALNDVLAYLNVERRGIHNSLADQVERAIAKARGES